MFELLGLLLLLKITVNFILALLLWGFMLVCLCFKLLS